MASREGGWQAEIQAFGYPRDYIHCLLLWSGGMVVMVEVFSKAGNQVDRPLVQVRKSRYMSSMCIGTSAERLTGTFVQHNRHPLWLGRLNT